MARFCIICADPLELYLADWEALLRELDFLFGDFEQLFLFGRGASAC